jgi:hypothetical protein
MWTKTSDWKTFWLGVLASVVAALLMAMIFGSPASRTRLRLEFDRAPAAAEPHRDTSSAATSSASGG